MASDSKMTKNAKRRAKLKEQKLRSKDVQIESQTNKSANDQADGNGSNVLEPKEKPQDPVYTSDDDFDMQVDDAALTDLPTDHPMYRQMKAVIDRFGAVGEDERKKREQEKGDIGDQEDNIPEEKGSDEDSDDENARREASRKESLRVNRMSIAELKARAPKPELVEWGDENSPAPLVLAHIKAKKNVVPVPQHWSLKREYLSNKRGVQKTPYALPKYLADTGISEMRDHAIEKQEAMTLKQKQRARVQPKMGGMDVDYSKLYDAFFVHQTKPRMSGFGEVYYEGKEYEADVRHLRPGEISEELQMALELPVGGPPSWLDRLHVHGPPPSYPKLQIPGLNAPIPAGAKWGSEPGAWPKPPTDDKGNPRWGGDVFGVAKYHQKQKSSGPKIDRRHWGELEPEPEPEPVMEDYEMDVDEDEEDEEEEEDTSKRPPQKPLFKPVDQKVGRTESVSEYGRRTAGEAQRRDSSESATGPSRSAGVVVPEQRHGLSSGFFASDKSYDLSAGRNKPMLGSGTHGGDSRKRKAEDVDLSVDIDALAEDGKVDQAALKAAYEQKRKQEANKQFKANTGEDFSDMVAEESNKRRKHDHERHERRDRNDRRDRRDRR